MKSITQMLIMFALLASASAQSMTEARARQSSRDVKIPTALVARLEKDYREFLVKNQVLEQKNIQRKLLNLSVELTQERIAALQENYRVVTPLGGGVIDLEDFVTPLKGSFRAKIVATNDKEQPPENMRVFYISRAKSRQIGGETYGAGCQKFMEITKYYWKTSAVNGFELYTADQRYLSVLGGTFLVTAFDKEALHVGGVTFTDGRHTGLLCEDR